MPVIDDRGRLLGRFNLIDALVLLMVMVVVPISYIAYRAFRTPPPVIASVAPATLPADGLRRVRVEGEHFRPYLRAFVSKTGEPFSMSNPLSDTLRAVFLIESPSLVELKLPDVPPGTYDLYLYDEGQEVARRASAFTLERGPEAPAPTPNVPHDEAVLEIAVRFEADKAVIGQLRVGDKDLNQPEVGIPVKTAATVTTVRPLPAAESLLTFRLADGGRLTASADATRDRVEATVRLGAVQNHGVWVYPGPQRIRAGETFSFATSAYVISGIITRASVLTSGARTVTP